MKLKRPLRGGETGGDVLAVQRALNAAPSSTLIKVTKVYDATTLTRMAAFQGAHGIIPASGYFGQRSLDALWRYFDAYGRARYRLYPGSTWQNIGPVVPGGRSVLDEDPTHDTDGIPLFIAFDTAFSAGQELIAPEDMVVDTKLSSAHPGEAFYATGKSGIRWWIAHHDHQWPLGTQLRKGRTIGHVIPTSVGGGPHCHVALNVETLLGKGEQLKYGRTGRGPDYTRGSPPIGAQLERAML